MSVVFDTPALVAFATGTSRVPEAVISLAESRAIIVPAGALTRALHQLGDERAILREFVAEPQVVVAQLDRDAALAIADLRWRTRSFDPVDAHTLYCASVSYAQVLTGRSRMSTLKGYGLPVPLSPV